MGGTPLLISINQAVGSGHLSSDVISGSCGGCGVGDLGCWPMSCLDQQNCDILK